MDIQIKKVGDKLKSLRKSIGLKQEDLVKHNVINSNTEISFTRNLISMVETDKSPLTKKLAESIHENLIIACKERGMTFECDFDEICMTPEDQIYRYIATYKNNGFDSMLFEDAIKYGEELITLSENYNLQPALSSLYRFLGEKCKRINLELASKYYLKATVFKGELTNTEHTSLIKSLKAVFIRLGKYSDALELKYDKASTTNPDTLKCHFNDILCLKKLQRYDDGLSLISEISDFLESEDTALLVKIKMLEANIFQIKGDTYNSMKIYTSLLSKPTISDNYILIRTNLIKLKIIATTCTLSELDEFSKIIFNNSIALRPTLFFFKTLSEAYEEFDMIESVSYFKKSIDLVLMASVVSAETKIYFNEIICGIIDNKDKMDVFLQESDDNFKILVASGLERKLLTADTVFKVLLHFQNKLDYQFVNKLLSSKVS